MPTTFRVPTQFETMTTSGSAAGCSALGAHVSERIRRRAERELRRRVRRELQALEIQPPLRVDVVCQRLGERRGRPIRLVAYPIPVPGPFGLWIATTSADYILYQAETTRVHQDHIILHEVGHILAGHVSADTDDSVWTQLMPNIAPEVIRRMLRRTSYDAAHEREAELVATIIQEWAVVLDVVRPELPVERSADVERLDASLQRHYGWL